MSEKPILFSSAMVRAILDGRKTQTRRVIKPQPTLIDFEGRGRPPAIALGEEHCIPGIKAIGINLFNTPGNSGCVKVPYGQPGDRLWVRETFNGEPGIGYAYKATEPEMDGAPWKPSIHMPRSASRLTLEITGVRVERVQEISEGDCYAEGIYQPPMDGAFPHTFKDVAMVEFKALWDSINAVRGFGWEVNPWVWVIEFKRLSLEGRAGH